MTDLTADNLTADNCGQNLLSAVNPLISLNPDCGQRLLGTKSNTHSQVVDSKGFQLRTKSPPKGGLLRCPQLPPRVAIERMMTATIRSCHDCKKFTGLECSLTMEVGTCVYCLEFVAMKTSPPLVRCADCSSIHYHYGPPESLSCDRDLVVTIASVSSATRCCALFNNRHKETANV